MIQFAALLQQLAFQPRRSAKLRLIADYFAHAADPDRGYALAALTGSLEFRAAKPALVRQLVAERVDETLFAHAYDYVGDLAETAALIWPEQPSNRAPPRLADTVRQLRETGKAELPAQIAAWLDVLDVDGRWALIKLMTGGLRIGVSTRLAKTALAMYGNLDVNDIEEVWHAQSPPYEALFAWAEGRQGRPQNAAGGFRPVMLAQALDETMLDDLDPDAYAAEWKWDGARIQIAAEAGTVKLYSRSGDEISRAFPEIVARVDFDAVLDGELLVVREGVPAPFSDLQRRLNRKTAGKALQRDYPCQVWVYDMLFEGGEDLRVRPFVERRRRLECWFSLQTRDGLVLSPGVSFDSWDALCRQRAQGTGPGIEGLMLKRLDSAYLIGRPKGPWFKWKRDPFLVDTVLMYAQRGHGKRSSFYSDYTFGVWRHDELVPVGKAYFGFTDDELQQLDKWVRQHTTNRFGPVREVEQGLVLEVAFEGVQESKRHKAGLALRFPRIHRIRWDKPAGEADSISSLSVLVGR